MILKEGVSRARPRPRRKVRWPYCCGNFSILDEEAVADNRSPEYAGPLRTAPPDCEATSPAMGPMEGEQEQCDNAEAYFVEATYTKKVLQWWEVHAKRPAGWKNEVYYEHRVGRSVEERKEIIAKVERSRMVHDQIRAGTSRRGYMGGARHRPISKEEASDEWGRP